ncbi:TraX family protein [Oribacterium sp. WCC10]|uniref:TraX family protein n=1 Tax=Oribacterium sp. WCC10 TaxID=1855343 RepID=UPI0008EE47F8|nr:TraX family protein [Oribacterium sp. WCC10]SFG74282.1 TraX protein [Oribacterium sp. WCC10]
MRTKGLNGNQLKMIAMVAMTIDHLASVIWPGYPTDWWIVLLHIIGRLAAPIFWFMVAEGYHHTHDLKKYVTRLLIFAVVGHFAYNFAFGIPFIPFQNSVFNQTSVIWSLFLGLIGLWVSDNEGLREWQKTFIILLLTILAFCADWSSIAVLAVIYIGENRGNFKKQMTLVMMWVLVYAIVYAIFINLVYGIIQLFVCLTIPLLKAYNGERGKMKNMKYLFYIYYPAHLIVCGIVRVLLHGNVGVMIGG